MLRLLGMIVIAITMFAFGSAKAEDIACLYDLCVRVPGYESCGALGTGFGASQKEAEAAGKKACEAYGASRFNADGYSCVLKSCEKQAAYKYPPYLDGTRGACRASFASEYEVKNGANVQVGAKLIIERYAASARRPNVGLGGKLVVPNYPEQMVNWADPLSGEVVHYRLTIDSRSGFSLELRPGISQSKLTNFLIKEGVVHQQGTPTDDFFFPADAWTKQDMEFFVNYGGPACGLWSAMVANAVNTWAYARQRPASAETSVLDEWAYALIQQARLLTPEGLDYSEEKIAFADQSLLSIMRDIEAQHNDVWVKEIREASEDIVTERRFYASGLKSLPSLLGGNTTHFRPCIEVDDCVGRAKRELEAARKAGEEAHQKFLKEYYETTWTGTWKINVKGQSGAVDDWFTIEIPPGICHVETKITVRSANPNVGSSAGAGDVVSIIVVSTTDKQMKVEYELPFAGINYGGYALDNTRVWMDAQIDSTFAYRGSKKCDDFSTVETGRAPPFKSSGNTPQSPPQSGGRGNPSRAVSQITIHLENDDPFDNTVYVTDRVAGGMVYQGRIAAHKSIALQIGASDAGYGSITVKTSQNGLVKGYDYLKDGEKVAGW